MWRTVRLWFDPDEVRSVGTTPDYRFSLANERTFLAWMRTALALIGGGLAVAQFLPHHRLRVAIAVSLLALGGLVAIRSVDHWARSEKAMRQNEALPPSRFPAILAIVITVGAAVLLIATLV
ncbi:YidH family protein [Dactylosporangium sp. CS-047395]|uniref:YidH family protein n=1 Tax=Dactylosporangium sp. CS-047395 TaxID=3239936 RepID=UPI003D8AFC85